MTNPDLPATRPTPRHASRPSIALLLAGVLAAAPLGCKKKEEPAPPPPPPVVVDDTPPEPDPVDMRTLAAQMRLDRRVQIADAFSTNKEPLARAALAFANALAKGDHAAFGDMLDPQGKKDLRALIDDDLWQDETKKIEAVRLVSIGAGSGGFGSFAGSFAAPTKEQLRAQIDMAVQMFQNMPEPMKDQIKAGMGGEELPANADEYVAWMKKILENPAMGGSMPPAMLAQAREMIAMWDKAEEPAAAPAESEDTDAESFTIVVAIQEPGVAYARGWNVVSMGGKWVFKGSAFPVFPDKPRASDFDDLASGGHSPMPSIELPEGLDVDLDQLMNNPPSPGGKGGGPAGG
ncbi:MAG: hypothetical protein HRU70_05200 [Phycisphaeraceae bacterium]|nr:MAG: hypothetical protein HRU70_05200 [Phycisphaeraceae bacterium]